MGSEWSVEPVRPTNGAHLRKGFLKMLETKFGSAKKDLSAENVSVCLSSLD